MFLTGRVYLCQSCCVFAPGLEECEGLLVVDILRRAGVEVTIAAVGGSKTVVSSHKVQIVADAMAGEIDPAGYDACILPGGIPGVNNLAADADVRRVTVACAEAGKIVAAICAGPTVLAGFGLLGGKQATVYPGMDDKMDGAVCTGSEVTVDGKITTGRALGAAIPFALELAAQLAGREASDRVRQAIVYPY